MRANVAQLLVHLLDQVEAQYLHAVKTNGTVLQALEPRYLSQAGVIRAHGARAGDVDKGPSAVCKANGNKIVYHW